MDERIYRCKKNKNCINTRLEIYEKTQSIESIPVVMCYSYIII